MAKSNHSDLKKKLKRKAEKLGANLVGFANVERWENAEEINREFFPQTIWPWSKTVIVLGVQIYLPMIETTPSVVYSELYNTTNRMLDEMAYKIANVLNKLGHKAFFFPRDCYGDISVLTSKPEAAFSHVVAGNYAGLGTIGFNHTLITKEYGPRIRLVSVITDAEITPDPMIQKDLCINCRLCQKECPTKAFTARSDQLVADMDKYKCADYHQQLKNELRYPCGVCTAVCPVGDDRKIYGKTSVSKEGIKHCQSFGSRNAIADYDHQPLKNENEKTEGFEMSERKYKFETLQLHVGQEQPDSATDARAVPIYQTTSYVFANSAQAAGRFGLSEGGNIYTRIMNPTTDVFEQRIAALEGGVAALALSSGAAATTYAIQNIAKSGDHIVAAQTLYGGTYNLFAHTLKDFGIETSFVDPDNLNAFINAIRPNTKAIFIESLGNPNSSIIDIESLSKVAHDHGIPLIVDNTFATPYLLRPIELGADIIVHSATKFIGGHGTSIGGVIVDGGHFNWAANDKFPGLSKPNPSYHGVVFTDAAGAAAYITCARVTLLRDTGAALSPFHSFLFLQGLETLSLRIERHVENALKVVDFLVAHPKVERVNHPSRPESGYKALYNRYFPHGAASIFTFEIKGGAEEAKAFIDKLKIFSLLANVADVKSLVIHPASTTHSQMNEQELLEAGIKPNTIRLSIGTEHIDDLIYDLTQAFDSL